MSNFSSQLKAQGPNLLTFLGLACTLINLGMLVFGERLAFWPFLLLLNAAILLDLGNGILARKLQLTSKIGAILDSIHDFLLYLVLPLVYFWRNFSSFLLNNNLLLSGFALLVLLLLFSGIWRLNRCRIVSGIIEENGQQFYLGLPVVYNLILLILTNLFSQLSFSTAFVILVIYLLNLIILMPSKLKIYKIPLPFVLGQLLLLNILFLLT